MNTDKFLNAEFREVSIKQLLCHEKLSVRFLTLLGISTLLFLIAWSVSYAFLPEGILRGRTGAAVLAGEQAAGSFLLEFLRIAAINLGMLVVFVLLPNRLLEVRGYPLGYLTPLLWTVFYAITLGTNSFSIPLPEPMAPSLAVLGRSGPYEIMAYLLAAASTHQIAIARTKSLFSRDSQPVEPKPDLRSAVNWIGLGLALLVLLAANAWEAYRIVSVA